MLVLVTLVCGSFLMLSFLVFAKSRTENPLANRWLSLFLLFVGLLLLEDCLARSGAFIRFPHLFGTFDGLVFSLMPSLYIAIRCFVVPDARLSWKTGLHFLPTLLFMLGNAPTYLLDTDAKRRLMEQNLAPTSANSLYSTLFISFILVHGFVYLGLSYQQLRAHVRNIQQVNTAIEPLTLHWLSNVLIGVLLLLLFWTAEGLVQTKLTVQVVNVGYLFGAYYIGFYAVQQQTIYPYQSAELAQIAAVIDQKPLRVAADTEALKEKLTRLMTTQKPYLDNNLNLLQLAQAMQLSTHELSALINGGFGVNFYQYVNGYRVEESKRLLTDPAYDHLSMVGIAYEAGFNSKTVFNTAFKAATDLSPTDYRKSRR